MNAISTAAAPDKLAAESRMLATARWLVVLLPICYVFNRVPTDIDLSLVTLIFLLRSAVARDWGWMRSTWFRVAMVLWVWMLIVSAFALDHRLAFQQSLFWWRFLVFAAALEWWIMDEITMRRVLWTATAAVVAVASDAWLQYLTGTDVLGHPRVGDRLTGPFSDLRVGSWTQRILFPVILGSFTWGLWRHSRKAATAALSALFVVGAGAVLLSGERMALLLTLMGLALAGILKRGIARRVVLTALGAIVAAALVLAASTHWFVDRYVDQTAPQVEHVWDSSYGHIWHSALHIIAQRPFMGVGLKNFRVACSDPRYALPDSFKYRCETHPHNLYLEWLVGSGAIGLGLFVALIAAWGARLVPPLLRGTASPWQYGPTIAVFLILWPLGPSSSFFSNWYGGVFYLSLGWALAAVRMSQGGRAAASLPQAP